jgi:nucleoid DNA-binding protein
VDYPTIVEKLADQQNLSEVKVRAIVQDLIALLADSLKNVKAVRIGGLGVLRVRSANAGVASAIGGESRALRA